MTKSVTTLVLLCAALASTAAAQSPTPSAADLARWSRYAAAVTITRDDWGIPHISGKTDTDAVFGLLYAQAEDDFNRVETNYFVALGRAAESEGEDAIYRDLRYRLINNPDSLKAIYARSPRWLQSVMNAWADGLNYYLYKHPEVKPKVITHFEPWMPLAFSDGSIGPDIESVGLTQLAAFYGGGKREAGSGKRDVAQTASRLRRQSRSSVSLHASRFPLPASPDRGSNGAAIAPSNTLSHHALLLINPHTSFFFRAEVQVTSQEGLNAYGAVTWGQFFVYQGFNERAGWMHSSTGADNIDEYLEMVTKRGNHFVYRYGNSQRPVTEEKAVIRYRTRKGMSQKAFTIYRTHHGPVVRAEGGKWVSVRLMQRPMNALVQSFTRMKARDLKSFRQTMELHTNSSNNTTYANADGDIAYFHSNFIPRRDTSFDWTRPVDGSDPGTEWKGVLALDESPNVINPPNGWVYNSNNWPWSAAGPYSPKREDFPAYVEKSTEESSRGRHALRVLSEKKDFTVASLIGAAYDSWLPSFARMIPGLLKSFDNFRAPARVKADLAAPIAALRAWDYRWGTNSIATSLAVFWGEDLFNQISPEARGAGMSAETYAIERATDVQRVLSLVDAKSRLERDFGRWQTPWGEINRFQRITDDIAPKFDDSAPSIPVPFTSARWGSLASFAARAYPGTKKWYGTSGNSFVAVIEFGDSVRARAITAGGESGDPSSPHFNDEALRYSTGNLREVYFYPSQLEGHTERVYHPGAATAASAGGQTQGVPLTDYEGVYAYHGGTSLMIVASDSNLFAVIDEAKYPLRSIGADRFLNSPGDTIPFRRDANGDVSGFVERTVFFPRRTQALDPALAADVRAGPRPPGPDGAVAAYRYSIPPDLGDGIATGNAADAGFDTATVSTMVRRVIDGTYQDVHSILVYRGGKLVVEEYFYAYDRDRPHQMRSATKSVVSALVGLAIDRGALTSESELVTKHLPYAGYANADPRKTALTFRDLLTMQSGLACDDWDGKSPGNESRVYLSPDWVKFVLDLPMIAQPGTRGSYCSGGVAVMGRIVERATGKSLPAFAQEALFSPLGIRADDVRWNYTLSSSNATTFAQLYLRPRDMLKLGILFQDHGSWNGRQVISRDWVARSTGKWSTVGDQKYGYFWWHQWVMASSPTGPRRVDMIVATGNGGQKIYLVPSLDLIVVQTGGNYNSQSPAMSIMAKDVLPVLLR